MPKTFLFRLRRNKVGNADFLYIAFNNAESVNWLEITSERESSVNIKGEKKANSETEQDKVFRNLDIYEASSLPPFSGYFIVTVTFAPAKLIST